MKIYYYLSNNGDGTGTPMFCDSEELADIMEEFDTEKSGMGWGDSCVGSLTIKSTCAVFPDYDYTLESAITGVKQELKDCSDSEYIQESLRRLEALR